MAKAPVRVTVTGAAGQIGYALLYRIASGEMLGKDQPVVLQMLELPMEKAQAALKGVMMELEDCAFPLLAGMVGTSDPMVAFKDTDYALLVGARPRGPGMERKDLLLENAKIFIEQGKALNAVASRKVRVLVVGHYSHRRRRLRQPRHLRMGQTQSPILSVASTSSRATIWRSSFRMTILPTWGCPRRWSRSRRPRKVLRNRQRRPRSRPAKKSRPWWRGA